MVMSSAKWRGLLLLGLLISLGARADKEDVLPRGDDVRPEDLVIKSDSNILAGEDYLMKDDYAGAMAYFEELVDATSPPNTEYYIAFARAAMASPACRKTNQLEICKEHLGKVVSVVEEAKSRGVEHAALFYFKGKALLSLLKNEEAFEAFAAALSLAPRHIGSLVNTASMLYQSVVRDPHAEGAQERMEIVKRYTYIAGNTTPRRPEDFEELAMLGIFMRDKQSVYSNLLKAEELMPYKAPVFDAYRNRFRAEMERAPPAPPPRKDPSASDDDVEQNAPNERTRTATPPGKRVADMTPEEEAEAKKAFQARMAPELERLRQQKQAKNENDTGGERQDL